MFITLIQMIADRKNTKIKHFLNYSYLFSHNLTDVGTPLEIIVGEEISISNLRIIWTDK